MSPINPTFHLLSVLEFLFYFSRHVAKLAVIKDIKDKKRHKVTLSAINTETPVAAYNFSCQKLSHFVIYHGHEKTARRTEANRAVSVFTQNVSKLFVQLSNPLAHEDANFFAVDLHHA